MSMDLVQIFNDFVIDAGTALATSATSSTVELKNAKGYAAQIVWADGTGTTGNVIVEATNDEPDTTQTFTQISTDAVAATSGSLMKNNTGAEYSYVRIRWDRTGGTTGTIYCKVSVKR